MAKEKTLKTKFKVAFKNLKNKTKKFLSTQTKAKVAALTLAIFTIVSAATIGGGELYKGYFVSPTQNQIQDLQNFISTPITTTSPSPTTGNSNSLDFNAPTTFNIDPNQLTVPDTGNINWNFDTELLEAQTTTPPTVIIEQPTANRQFQPATSVTVNATVTDPYNEITSVTATYSGSTNSINLTRTQPGSNLFRGTFTTPTTPQTYQITIRATNSIGLTTVATRNYQVIGSTTTPPTTPPPTTTPLTTTSSVLLLPEDLSTNVSITPTFRWESRSNSTYTLQVSRGNNLDNLVLNIPNLTANSYTLPSNNSLENASVYTWRVIATQNNETYNYAPFRFTTVANNVTPPTNQEVLINFTNTTSSIIEANTTVNIEVNLSRSLPYDLEVPYTLRSSSTATINQDFTLPNNRFLTFTAGTTRQSIPVRILDDNTREFDETVILRLNAFNFEGNVKIGTRNEHTLTIVDNDGGLAPTPIAPGTKVSCEKYFIDVDRFHPLCEQLTYLRELNIFRGQVTNSGNRADLNSQLKRSEYFAIATRLLNRDQVRVASLNPVFRFRDMTPAIVNNPNNSWWITATVQLDTIIRGFGPENFKTLEAERVTTEAEIAKVALEGKFRDFRNRDFLEPWFTDTLEFMAQYGFYIDPTRPATRADAVEILYVILQIEQDRNFYRNFAF